ITPDMIVDVVWIDFMLVSLLYTFIGFQAIRKIWRYDSLIRRFAIDYIQIMLISAELLLLIAVPTDWQVFTETFPNFVLYYIYLFLVIVLVVEAFWWFDQLVNVRRETSGRSYSAEIVLIQVMGMFLPLLLLLCTLPFPLYLIFINFFSFLIIILVLLITTVFSVLLYDLLAIVGISTRVTQKINEGMQPFRFKISMAMASRGAIFNFPPPTDILGANGPSGEPIEHRRTKVKLKIACGQCYHVFNVVTTKTGPRGTFPVFPCPLCGSVATTPVWE
ncbi:MAG: hypothetical protein JSV04_08195, partial [Candidatus Heimdallarchaeota archaeon]